MLNRPDGRKPTISAIREMGAYEALWLEPRASFKTIAAKLARGLAKLPSDLVSDEHAMTIAEQARQRFAKLCATGVEICAYGMESYPRRLRDALHPLALIYYQGALTLSDTAGVAVVGTRQPSVAGREQTRKLVTELVADSWTIISGLAAGIDTEAHTAAINAGDRTIAVTGTPISHTYAPKNEQLQAYIATYHLAVSQVPLLRFEASPARNRSFFPARNITMSALSRATIIMEASETWGTPARHCDSAANFSFR